MIESVLRSRESTASMKTRRELEWNAWEEKPRSMRATAQVARSAIQLRRRFTGEATGRILTFDGRSQEVPRNVDVNCESLVECYFRGHI